MTEALREYYDDVASEWVKHVPSRAVRQHIRCVLAHAPDPCPVALDIGCGTGVYTAPLRDVARQVIGVDFSAQMLAHAVPGVSVCQADAVHLPVRDAAVQYVVSCGLTEHIRNPTALLAEVARVLKPAGIAMIRFRRRWSPWRLVGSHRYPGGLAAFSPSDLRRYALSADLRIVSLHPLMAAGPFTTTLPAVADVLDRFPGLSQCVFVKFVRERA